MISRFAAPDRQDAGDWRLDSAIVEYGTCPINGAHGVRVGSVWGARGVRVESVESEAESRLRSRISSTRTSSMSDHSQDLRCSQRLPAERAAGGREISHPLANA